MHRLDGKPNQIINLAKNQNLPLEVIQLDVDNDKSELDAINKILSERERVDAQSQVRR